MMSQTPAAQRGFAWPSYRKRVASLLLAVAVVLAAGCMADQGPLPSARIQDSACGYSFEYEPLEPLPAEYHGIHPTHAVRAQAYACVDNGVTKQWEAIGGLASVRIEAVTIDPRVVGEAVKGGSSAPFPYENISARLGFNFPLYVEPGIEVGISAHFTSILDRGELLSCWISEPDGHPVQGSRYYTVQTQRGQPTTVDCGALVGETA